jgi:hypothetical protein
VLLARRSSLSEVPNEGWAGRTNVFNRLRSRRCRFRTC